jgi:3-oxoacyl-[acyl-carrier protein] reductase
MGGELDERITLVTGSTRGIGRAIAERLSAEGARLVVNGRSAADAERVAKELGAGAIAVAADVSDPAQAEALVQTILDRFGRIDILVNNAGIARDNYISKISNERWAEVLGTNLSAPLYLARAAVPAMRKQGVGSILNLLSWSGLRGNVGQAAYSATKAGLYGLTLSLAKELGKFGIRVNGISPAVPTE